jgi:hypothetical protein
MLITALCYLDFSGVAFLLFVPLHDVACRLRQAVTRRSMMIGDVAEYGF